MIISRTPLRVSFVGGGSDLPCFYKLNHGAVLSTTINKFVYINVNKKFDNGIRVAYSKNEEVEFVKNLQHPLVRETLEMVGISGGVEITSIADIPSKGSGLGSSSSFTVGLINALSAYKGLFSSKDRLAESACEIEINKCREPIGKQDQYAAAFGGFNFMEFNPDGTVVVSPVICSLDIIKRIENSLLLFYTGKTRSASDILRSQSHNILNDEVLMQNVNNMVNLAHDMRSCIQSEKINLIGEILHESWSLKKTLSSNITNPEIDHWYNLSLKAGATGGKILGAGAGGFLLVFAPSKKHNEIISSLSELKYVPFKFENSASSIIYYDQ